MAISRDGSGSGIIFIFFSLKWILWFRYCIPFVSLLVYYQYFTFLFISYGESSDYSLSNLRRTESWRVWFRFSANSWSLNIRAFFFVESPGSVSCWAYVLASAGVSFESCASPLRHYRLAQFGGFETNMSIDLMLELDLNNVTHIF